MQMRVVTQSRRKDSSSPLNLGTEAHWILSAAGRWTEEDDKEWKREQHRENMVSFRLKKKEQRSQLKTQHRVLETQLKQKLTIQRAAAARGARLAAATYSASHHRSIMTSSPILDKTFTMHPMQQALTDLVSEKEALRGENAALEKQITEHMKLQKMIQKEGELLSSDDEMDQQVTHAASPVQHGLLSSSPSLFSPAHKGSFVTIEGGGPAFFYEPLSAQDCEVTMRRYRQRFDYTPPRYVAGNMFGWQIERTLSQDVATGALFSRVWYTKRITCPHGNAAALLEKIEHDSWGILVQPELYAKIHRQDLKSKTLQVLNDDAYVMARSTFNTQYNMHIRYLNLVARAEAVTATGQRALNQYLLIPDSSANRLARDADPHADVKWVLDGGAFMSFIQVDDATVDVVYDHFACCASAQQADFFMIDWGNIVIRWEQLVHPARMLL